MLELPKGRCHMMQAKGLMEHFGMEVRLRGKAPVQHVRHSAGALDHQNTNKSQTKVTKLSNEGKCCLCDITFLNVYRILYIVLLLNTYVSSVTIEGNVCLSLHAVCVCVISVP